MATLAAGASGVVGHSGTARARRYFKAVALDGMVGVSGAASGIVVAGILVTTAGVQLDVTGAVPAQLTQLGAQVDVQRIVPAQVTTLGVDIDVERIVPAQVTTAGIGLDVDRIVPAQLTTIGAQIDARLKRIRTLTMCWEFHVYNRAGVYLAYLDNAFDKSYLTQLWDVGGGSMKLPTDDAKATTTNIKVGNIVKVRYANVDIGAWLMENIATTYVDTGEGAARIITVSGRGLLASLAKGLVYPTDLNDPATVERTFTDATKADILLTFYEEYVARGGGIFTTAFTDTNDSDSVAWTDSVSLKYKAGQSILDVLRQLQGFGLEVVARPDKTLDAYVNTGSDISANVAFRYGQNVLACSTNLQGSDIANSVLGEGSDILDEDTDATSISEYGRLEAYLPVRNTAAADDIAAANVAFLAQFKDPPNSIALQVATFPDYPIMDYNVGDTVHVSIPDTVDADYRILAIAMQEGSGPCDLRVSLELNSLQAEYLARVQRAMDASLASVPPGTGAASGLVSTGTTSEPGSGAWASLGDLNDVTITSAADNDLLAYDSGSGAWINQTATEAALTPATLTTKGDLLTWGTAHERLEIGTVGHVLTVGVGTVPAWAMGSVTQFAHEYQATGGTAGAYPVIYGTAGTVTLPTVGDNTNVFYYIVNSGIGTVTASPTWGTATKDIEPLTAIMVHSNGTAWAVI